MKAVQAFKRSIKKKDSKPKGEDTAEDTSKELENLISKTKCEPSKSSTEDGDKDKSCSRRERKCDDDFDYENEYCQVVKKKSSPSKLSDNSDEKLSIAFKNSFGKLKKSKGKET